MQRGPKTAVEETKVVNQRWIKIIGDKVEVRYWPSGKPEMPSGMTGSAKNLWNTRIQRLIDDGVATVGDQEMLESMCDWWETYSNLRNKLRKATPGTTEYTSIFNQKKYSYEKFEKIAEAFGMTPKSRGKILLPDPVELARGMKVDEPGSDDTPLTTQERRAKLSADLRVVG